MTRMVEMTKIKLPVYLCYHLLKLSLICSPQKELIPSPVTSTATLINHSSAELYYQWEEEWPRFAEGGSDYKRSTLMMVKEAQLQTCRSAGDQAYSPQTPELIKRASEESAALKTSSVYPLTVCDICSNVTCTVHTLTYLLSLTWPCRSVFSSMRAQVRVWTASKGRKQWVSSVC